MFLALIFVCVFLTINSILPIYLLVGMLYSHSFDISDIFVRLVYGQPVFPDFLDVTATYRNSILFCCLPPLTCLMTIQIGGLAAVKSLLT